MDPTSYYADLVKAFRRELVNLKEWAVGIFLLAAFIFLVLGFFWPKSYVTSTLLSVDESNIIAPLLAGKAAVTNLDRSQQARELIYTRRIMEAAARQAGLMTGDEPVAVQESIIAGLRSNVTVQTEGQNQNYFRIGYSSNDPDQSFQVLNAVVNVFIEDAADRKRAESRSAYEFINAQVNAYRRQLQSAEDRLKAFRVTNLEGVEVGSSGNRINSLKMEIEELKIKIDEIHSRERSIQEQLQDESQYLAARNQIDGYRERLHTMQTQLDTLRLSYMDSYPDIISLKEQIAELRSMTQRLETDGGIVMTGQSAENPLYEDLRRQLASTQTELRSQHRRLQVLTDLLEQEYERAKRVAGNQAEISELTRDYNVTKQIYEDMLESKEKARLSMTLDVEGQGVSYKIQEPARFPIYPAGLRFVHFAVAGPFLALLVPIGLIIGYIVLDPRIRSVNLMQMNLPPDIQVLGVTPHMRTPVGRRILQGDVIRLGVMVGLALAAYIGIAAARLLGKF